MKIQNIEVTKTTAQLIYNKESGDHYCLAATPEIADAIIEDAKQNEEDWEDLTYVELNLFDILKTA